MSVRSRIKEFEALAKASDGSKEKTNETKKRFHYPGKKRTSDSEEVASVNNFSMNGHIGGKIKTQILDEFEADLQEVWSVRKNIHHQGTSAQASHSSSSPSVHNQVKAGLYSRHGAIPAQQTGGPKPLLGTKGKGHSFETRRSPLQEQNSKDTPWNVKKSTYSYNSTEMATKRPIGSPQASEISSPPTAKRRGNAGIFDMIRPTNADQRIANFTSRNEHHEKNEKVSYAKRMAQGYLRSVGLGEWTPKVNTSDVVTKTKQTATSKPESTNMVTSKLKKLDDDQDFDF